MKTIKKAAAVVALFTATSKAIAGLGFYVDPGSPWPSVWYNATVANMQTVVNEYNAYGDFTTNNDGSIYVYYNSGIPTEQSGYGGYGGSIGVGGTYPNVRVLLHESSHWLGTGTYSNYWTGPHATAMLDQFDGDGAVLNGDGQHYWPYGENYDNESSPINDLRHVAMVYALRQDFGNGNMGNPSSWAATSVTMTASDTPGTSGINFASEWSDNTFTHPNADYSTGIYVLYTPLGEDSSGPTPSFHFIGTSLTINNTNGNAGGLQFQGVGTSSVLTFNNLIINGGYIRNSATAGDLFQIGGTVTLASTGTIDAANGNINIPATIVGSGSFTKAGSYGLTLSAADTYTGNVVVNSGTLFAANGNNVTGRTDGPLGNPSVSGRTVTINSGGIVAFAVGNVLGTGAQTTAPALSFIVNPGGTLQAAAADAGGSGGGDTNIFGNLTFNGGTFTTGNGYNTAYQSAVLLGSVTTGGTATSTFNTKASNFSANGIMLGTSGGVTFNVASTGASGADLNVVVPLVNSNIGTAGSLIKTGAGKMLINSASTYTGSTNISAGTLGFGTAHSTIGGVTVARSATMQVQSIASNSTTLTSSSLSVGSSGGSSTLNFDLYGLDDTSSLVSTGAFSAAGTVNVVVQNGGALTAGTRKLISYTSYSGSASFTPTSFTLGPRTTGTLTNSTSSDALYLTVTGDRPVWTGKDNGNWTTSSTGLNKDWKLVTGGTSTNYLSGDNVTFDDSATGSTAINISSANVSPAAVTFNNSSKSYTVSSSSYGITGSGRLTKNGTGTVTLSTNNSYTGPTTINAGTLLAGNSSAIGSGPLTLNGGAFGSTAAVTIPNSVVAAGTGTIGYSGQANSITLSGVLSGSGTLTNYLGSNTNYNVFFTGDLSGFSGTLNYTCDANAATGWWRFGASNSITKLSAAAVVINKGNVTNLISTSDKNLGFTDGITGATLQIGSLSSDGVFQSSFSNSGPNALVVGSLNTSTTFSGVISGGAAGTNMSMTKVGSGTLTLTGSNQLTGATTISGGTLQLGNGGTSGSLAGPISDNTSLVLDRSNAMTQGTDFGVIGGSGSLTISPGSGAVTLNAGNPLTGNIVVNSSTVYAAFNDNNNLPSYGALGSTSLAGRTVTVNSGSLVAFTAGNVLGSGAQTVTPALSFIINQGGTVKTATGDAGGGGGGDANILGNVTLNGGTFTTGNGYNSAYQAAIFLGSVTITGSTASTINSNATNTTANGIMLGTAGGVTFNVAKTGASGADLSQKCDDGDNTTCRHGTWTTSNPAVAEFSS